MLIGQSVFIPSSSVIYYGPWMPRQGDAGTAVIEVLRESSSGWTLDYKVYTKNAEQPDSSEVIVGGAAVTSTGTHLSAFSGCKELVRVVYSCQGGGTDRWLHLRSNPIQWQPN